MKKISILLLVMMLISTLHAADTDQAEDMIKELAYLSIPVDHEHVSVQPGLTLSPAHRGFPIIGVNIPFGGSFYIKGLLGAGVDQYEQGELNLFTLGLGYYDGFPGIDDLNYSINASYRTLRSLDYSSSLLSGEFLVEQNFKSLYLGVGVHVSVQDYVISNSGMFIDASDRLIRALISVFLRSPYGNIEVKGMPDAVIAGVSWTLRLDG